MSKNKTFRCVYDYVKNNFRKLTIINQKRVQTSLKGVQSKLTITYLLMQIHVLVVELICHPLHRCNVPPLPFKNS